MKIARTIITAATLMAAVCLPAQNKSAGINLSLWKDISTQPDDTTQTSYVNIGLLSSLNRLNGVGINALGSVIHNDMNGVQITGLANLTGGAMRGVQIAGISNISGENSHGLALSGLVNITDDSSKGVFITGLTNITGDDFTGIMLSGLMNITSSRASGTQIAGLANITGSDCSGLMLAGFLNLSGCNMNGLQIAALGNVTANTMRGAQVGAFNYATTARGFQIGLINYYKEEMKGFQLGLVNANPDTQVQMMLYGGNASIANIGVRFKNQLFYTILGVGTYDRHLDNKFSVNASYRAGLSVPIIKKLSLGGDLGYRHIETCSNHNDWIPRRLYALEARANLEYRFTRKLGAFVSGGYGLTRYYNQSGNYHKGAIVEAGIVLF